MIAISALIVSCGTVVAEPTKPADKTEIVVTSLCSATSYYAMRSAKEPKSSEYRKAISAWVDMGIYLIGLHEFTGYYERAKSYFKKWTTREFESTLSDCMQRYYYSH